ncbi:HK97 family phage prohead protease [Streptomyces sp. NPDC088353]|uniref:HK97 family phage prohead protease n=1 Tax=Streptomyces sp. NPDC088353 TaxID=3365855 RepID=UPI00380BBD91
MSIQRLITRVEWKAAGDDPGSLEGYLSTFGNLDLQGDIIERGAFAKTVNKVNKDGVPLLADHRPSVRDVLGTIVQASEDSHGLRIRARFASDADSQAIRQKLVDGHLKAMSIGYRPRDWGYREEADGTMVRILKEVELMEGSVVVFPANTQALVDTVKSAVRDTVDVLVAGAVANGGDETELKAALLRATLPAHDQPGHTGNGDGDGAGGKPGDGKPGGSGDGGDVPAAAAAKKDDGQGEDGPARITRLMRQSENLLAGHDPDAVADPVKVAGLLARLDMATAWSDSTTTAGAATS